ncbi:MAG: acyl-ACP--UDP-N-acetylglucosamine O-acyltransferase [Planctomyces sp.]|nr:acyl-ACP--UDP-N-acetylglucosamine O-acyltransferase [Planctomyces sp.]
MPIHATAVVDPQADIHSSAQIASYVVIDGPVTVGAGCVIEPFTRLTGSVEVGPDCRIHSHVAIGDIPQDRRFAGENTRCVIGAGSILREGATVHRATGEGNATIIGERCFLMTNAHVGHNCVLGNDVTLISGSLLGGHVRIGDKAVVSGNTAVHQFTRIGFMSMVAGVSAVVQDVPPFAMTDHRGRVVGLNLVGLKRAGYTAEQREDIKTAFKLLYRSGIASAQIVEVLRSECRTDAVAPLIEFLAETSSRGICAASRGGR